MKRPRSPTTRSQQSHRRHRAGRGDDHRGRGAAGAAAVGAATQANAGGVLLVNSAPSATSVPVATSRRHRDAAGQRRAVRRRGPGAGAVPAAATLTIQFWLAPRAAAASYAAAVSTPGNPLFRHFLSPAAYTARFGATPESAASVESWLKSQGFTGVGADLGRDYVQATAPVSTIDAALQVRLNYYRAGRAASAGSYPLRANDRPVSLPASIAGRVLGVTGLDNAAPTMTYVRAGNPVGPQRGTA